MLNHNEHYPKSTEAAMVTYNVSLTKAAAVIVFLLTRGTANRKESMHIINKNC